MTPASVVKGPVLAAYGALLRAEVHSILVPLFKRMIVERLPDGRTVPVSDNHGDDRTTALFLSAEAFRGDPQFLANTGRIRVLELPRRWLTHSFHQFYPRSFDRRIHQHFMCPTQDDPTYLAKQTYQRVLRGLLARLSEEFGIDCVIGHHFHHMYDVDWGSAAQGIGLPYLVLHREGISFCRYAEDKVHQRIAEMGHFDGAMIAIQNPAAREICIDSGFVDPDRIVSMGSIRMDNFARRIEEVGARPKKDGIALLFAFGFTILEEQLAPYMDKTHAGFLRAAKAMPERQFVIKCKADMMDSWRANFDRACQAADLNPAAMANLRITADDDPNELILASSVVTTFNSSTMLEAGAAGRRVVLPYFAEIRTPEMRDYLYFYPGAYDLFDTPTDEAAYEAALIDGMRNTEAPSAEESAKRLALFERYLSPLDGGVTQRYVDLIEACVVKSRQSSNSDA